MRKKREEAEREREERKKRGTEREVNCLWKVYRAVAMNLYLESQLPVKREEGNESSGMKLQVTAG